MIKVIKNILKPDLWPMYKEIALAEEYKDSVAMKSLDTNVRLEIEKEMGKVAFLKNFFCQNLNARIDVNVNHMGILVVSDVEEIKFYRHKFTGLTNYAQVSQGVDQMFMLDGMDESLWDCYLKVRVQENEMVILPPKSFVQIGQGFFEGIEFSI